MGSYILFPVIPTLLLASGRWLLAVGRLLTNPVYRQLVTGFFIFLELIRDRISAEL
jgi:hypothetical protein